MNRIENLYKLKGKKKILHLLTPIHGNTGDQAIVYATNKYLRENFSEFEVIEIYRNDIYKYAETLKAILGPDDFIVLIGGGNLGNLWIEEEIDRRFVIKTFKDNKIISMPQTMDFTNDEYGKRELDISREIYNSHSDLTLIAREKKSYEDMNTVFTNAKVILNPDMVLYLNNTLNFSDRKRDVIMTCLRKDKESILKDKREVLIEQLKSIHNNIVNFDTVLNKIIFMEDRENELLSVWKLFSKSEVVITDRLHGMIFAAITRTPCIVARSIDHKIFGTYQWIKKLNFIFFVEELSVEEIEKTINYIRNIKEFNSIDVKEEYFDKLRGNLF